MTKCELIIKLESLFEPMDKNRQRNIMDLGQKTKVTLLIILQEVRCLFNEGNEIDYSDSVESSI